ncbi:MAG: hypothetical protein WBV77_11275, partial [Solirubrobacteraceae bacterium]
ILVAVLGTPSPDDALSAFDHGWLFMVIASVLGALAALSIGQIRPVASAARAGHAESRVAVEAS